jgi:hypothetical protein
MGSFLELFGEERSTPEQPEEERNDHGGVDQICNREVATNLSASEPSD